jgi:hypothetical protein
VSRAINDAIRQNGAICKRGSGYTGDPSYVASRPDADDYIPEIQDEIARAAELLAELRKTRRTWTSQTRPLAASDPRKLRSLHVALEAVRQVS